MSTYDITSLQNSRIKLVVKLNNRRQRDELGLTVVEGVREIRQALNAGITPQEAYVCPDLLDESGQALTQRLSQLAASTSLRLWRVSTAVFAKMAYRGRSGGLLIVIPYPERTLQDLRLGPQPFLVIVDGAEKPGNVGAILRTADAAGVDGLIVTGPPEARTDLYNPNVVRASLGTLFSVTAVATTTAECLAWLRENHIESIATSPDASDLYTAVDLTTPVAIVMGSEADGLSEQWLAGADRRVRIPMHGVVDSLNLASATALLLYEVVRQRSTI